MPPPSFCVMLVRQKPGMGSAAPAQAKGDAYDPELEARSADGRSVDIETTGSGVGGRPFWFSAIVAKPPPSQLI